MKTVVLDGIEFKNQNESISQTISAFVVIQDSQYNLKSNVFSTATLVGETKPYEI